MASTKVKAVVIGGVNIKEKDRLITIFSLERGKMVVSMKGVRGEKAKLKSAKEIFCFGDFVIEEGKNSNIVTSVDIIDSFYSLTQNLDKYYEGCAMLDIVSHVASEEQNAGLFIELLKALKSLAYQELKKYYVIDKFLINIFKAMGYGFLTDKCSSCGSVFVHKFLNLEVGDLVCANCKNALCLPVSEAAYSTIRLLNMTDYDKLSTVKFGGMGEVQVFNLLSKNYEYRTGFKLIEIL